MTRRPPIGDGWYESEEHTRVGMKVELQRIRRRTSIRPIPVLVAGVLVTAAVTYMVATKKRQYTADVVLAVSEGTLTSQKDVSIPFEQLKEYVSSVLMPDAELEKLIERRNPERIAKVGAPFALQDLRGRTEVAIWKNSFVYFHDYDANAQKSARVGISFMDDDPDKAHEIAREIADIVIRMHDEQRKKVSKQIAGENAAMRDAMTKKIDDLALEISVKQAALVTANKAGKKQLAALMQVDLAALAYDQKRAESQLAKIVTSPEADADQATAAQLDTTITVVDDVKPEKREMSGLVLAMIVTVVGTGALLGAALVLGAFDSRVHETDDVTRLGLPVLGHLPGFPGDHVGSLEARGAMRARVPSFLRWR